jgi:FAD/FMN-containing dehydrogenase
VIQGGMTGLAGGATPQHGEVAVSLERMTGVEDIDETNMTMVARAGTPLQALQEAALEKNLYLPIDLGARGSCTIGGNIATNAGGTEVIRFGMTRSSVLGLEAVLSDGTVVSAMNRMIKNNSGYDLKHLFIGTEGTLGVVSRVVLQLQPSPISTHTALCALEDYGSVISVLNNLKLRLGGGLTGFELMWANYFDGVIKMIPHLKNPFLKEHPFYLLLEYKDNDAVLGAERFEDALFSNLENKLLTDALIAQSKQDALGFWEIRDAVSEALPLLGPISNQDVSLPIGLIGDFAETAEVRLKEKYSDFNIMYFGHIGDNNLHAFAYTGRAEDVKPINHDIMHMIGEFGGAITAEHGVGILKKKYLSLSRTDNEIHLMRTLKEAMDPKGILNPGRVF